MEYSSIIFFRQFLLGWGNLFVSVANDVLFITCWVDEAINSGMKSYSKY